ncbi:Unknown protein [Striga hermonthica]|uniref:TF-B3 domain-containing protein n=1 Tax=Striga hermonthica TaxID=68872 RepID=A0A9N7P5R0_STRHE|nr:Unknown protein [Striga hermonthica]
MPAPLKRFFTVISNPGSRTMRLPLGLVHEYMLLVPLQCTLTTREGRTYEVTIRGNGEWIAFDEGWADFVAAEDIKSEYYLWFDRNSLREFVVTVIEENAVERKPSFLLP